MTRTQPLHTVYVPADRFSSTTVAEWGAEARRLLEAHAPYASSFGSAFALEPSVASLARERVAARLEREPIEDLRVDFEDGYGVRDDEEEDRHAIEAARALAGGAPSWFGARVKSFADGLEPRSLRTLELFVTELRHAPEGLVLTFPKVDEPSQVARFAEALAGLESRLGLEAGTLRFELQVETPRAVIAADGLVAAPALVEAGGGRVIGMPFGVFDYTSALGLMPWEQRLDHPANDLARGLLQVALAGSGVWISDGSTNVVPASDATEDVVAAWRAHAAHVRHSLSMGFAQGWDLHPSHLVSRYAAVYGWLLPRVDDARARVAAWRERASEGGVLDEPATISSLVRFLELAERSGAIDADG